MRSVVAVMKKELVKSILKKRYISLLNKYMFKSFFKKEEKSTEFSRFIRTASSRDKKKVFKRVLEKATQDQVNLLNKA